MPRLDGLGRFQKIGFIGGIDGRARFQGLQGFLEIRVAPQTVLVDISTRSIQGCPRPPCFWDRIGLRDGKVSLAGIHLRAFTKVHPAAFAAWDFTEGDEAKFSA
jgi:hypothetical protein